MNGPGKIIKEDGTSIVSTFKNGLPIGPVRKWNAAKMLESLFFAEHGSILSKFRQWKNIGKYLIWTEDLSTFHSGSNNESITIFVPFDPSDEILAGNYNSVTGLAHNLYSIDDILITSSKNECFLELKWKKKLKQPYTLIIFQDKVERINHSGSDICKTKYFDGMSTQDQFQHWHGQFTLSDTIDSEGITMKMFELYDSFNYINNPLEKDKVEKSFLSLKQIYYKDGNIMVDLSHWNGKTLPWIGSKIGFDDKGRLHGPCLFQLEADYYNQTGMNDFFHWSISVFSGRFINGKLQGAAMMSTWQGNLILATFKYGELHGPALSYGRSPVFDIWVR